jgi:hypothetical protein
MGAREDGLRRRLESKSVRECLRTIAARIIEESKRDGTQEEEEKTSDAMNSAREGLQEVSRGRKH